MVPKAGASERKRGDQRDGCGKLLSATTDLLEPACKAGMAAGADENSVSLCDAATPPAGRT